MQSPIPTRLFLLLAITTIGSCLTIFIDNVQLSTTNTLQPNTIYSINVSISNNDIPAGAKVVLTFSNRYQITGGTLSGCKASQSASTALATTTCASTSSTGNHFLTFPDIYIAGATAQTILMLQVRDISLSLASLTLMEVQEPHKLFLCRLLTLLRPL